MVKFNSKIVVAGFEPFTTIDFPDHIGCVVFLQGCPFKCDFCSNPGTIKVVKEYKDEHAQNWQAILEIIEKKKNILEAIVFSGGEPLVQGEQLISAIKDVKTIIPNIKIGLHTNGLYHQQLEKIIDQIDWVGMDIKAPKTKHDEITNFHGGFEKISKSLDILINSGKDFEVRTTCYPTVLTKEDVLDLAKFIGEKGVKNYALQRYHHYETVNCEKPDSELINQFFTDDFIKEVKKLFKNNLITRL